MIQNTPSNQLLSKTAATRFFCFIQLSSYHQSKIIFMKRSFLFFAALVFVCNISAFSQQTDVSTATETYGPSVPKGNKPAKNFVKINLMGLPLRNYSFQYERALSKRFSIALGYRFMPSGSLPLLSVIESAAGSDDKSTRDALRSLKISNTAITPEIRLYVGRKGYGRGFYLAPYYRYAAFEMNGLKVELEDGKDNIVFSGKLTTQNLGLMLGAQWMLSKRISLDWWIVGAQIGTHTSSLKGIKEEALTPTEKDDINKFSKDISFPNFKLNTEFIDNNTAIISTSGPWAGIRAGLCLGVRF
jgi:hypothetical protein